MYQVMENYITYSPWVYQVVGHVLSFGAAAMVAGLVYFLATAQQVSPRYRLSSFLSAVVMASAALELGIQSLNWEYSFVREGTTGAFALAEGQIFANGYRYANWTIDVPVLLTQLLIVLGVTGAAFWRNWGQFVVAGLAMIWTGYVSQLFEAVPVGSNTYAQTFEFWLWFFISWIFYIWILVIVFKVVWSSMDQVPSQARGLLKGIAILLLGSWTLYPVAAICPWLSFDQYGVLARQILFTVADVTSKVIYGVLLGYAATIRSAAEGFVPAIESLKWDQP